MENEPVCLVIRYGEERKVVRSCTALLARRKAEPFLPAEYGLPAEEADSPVFLLCRTGDGLYALYANFFTRENLEESARAFSRLLEAELFLCTDGHMRAFGNAGAPNPALAPPARSFGEAAKQSRCRAVVIR